MKNIVVFWQNRNSKRQRKPANIKGCNGTANQHCFIDTEALFYTRILVTDGLTNNRKIMTWITKTSCSTVALFASTDFLTCWSWFWLVRFSPKDRFFSSKWGNHQQTFCSKLQNSISTISSISPSIFYKLCVVKD